MFISFWFAIITRFDCWRSLFVCTWFATCVWRDRTSAASTDLCLGSFFWATLFLIIFFLFFLIFLYFFIKLAIPSAFEHTLIYRIVLYRIVIRVPLVNHSPPTFELKLCSWTTKGWPKVKVQVMSRALESLKFDHFQRLCPPPFIMGLANDHGFLI